MINSNNESIADILKSIDEGKTQLPDFQRGWVWEDGRIRALIASVSNGYPIGAAMFLQTGGDDIRRTRQTLWRAVQMLTQKLCCQTIHDCPKVVPLHYESE